MARQRLHRLPVTIRSDAELDEERERCTHSFVEFIRAAWPHVESKPLIWGWHLDAIAEHLAAVTRGHLLRLVINVPPGSSKTLLVQVFWPAWEWICDQHPSATGFRPDMKFLSATYEDSLATSKALLCRQLLESYWYERLFGDRWQQRADQWGAHLYANRQGGWRLATSVGGKGTGMHPDRQIVDDPTKPQDALAGAMKADKIKLENVWTWWRGTMSLRKADSHTARIVIMQRIHEMDLAGRLEKQGGYEMLKIPMSYEPSSKCTTVLERATDTARTPLRTWTDPRTEQGELMCPARFSAEDCQQRKNDLGPQDYAAQEQQRPSPAGGGTYKREWFRFWVVQPQTGVFVISADCTFKDLSSSDWVVVQVWCASAPDFYLLDQVRERLDVLGTCNAIASLRGKWKRVGEILVEDAANGPAVSQIMKKTVPGIRLVTPLGGKVARANASAVYHRSGNVLLPTPEHAPWVNDYIAEHTSFPFGANDDQVDAQSQAINDLAVGIAEYGKMLATMRQMGVA